MKTSIHNVKLAVCGVLLGSMLVACNSTKPAKEDNVDIINGGAVDEWWNNPLEVQLDMAVVGSAPYLGNPTAARRSAEVNARAQMAAMKKAKIQQLVEQWDQQTGDMKRPESVQSLVNNEAFTRQLVDEDIYGARAVKYKLVDGVQYVLMVLEDVGPFFDNVEKAIEAQSVEDETYWKTEVRKEDARKRLEQFREAEEAKVRERQAALGRK